MYIIISCLDLGFQFSSVVILLVQLFSPFDWKTIVESQKSLIFCNMKAQRSCLVLSGYLSSKFINKKQRKPNCVDHVYCVPHLDVLIGSWDRHDRRGLPYKRKRDSCRTF